MKKIIIFLSVMVALVGCVKNELIETPVVKTKIGSLVMTVSGEDYTAVPLMNDKKELTDTLLLTVKIPSSKATVKAIYLADPSATVDVKAGDEVTFENDIYTIHYTDSEGSTDYIVAMSYNPPPFLYVVKSGDRDEQRVRYWLDVNKNPHVASGTYDANYEGFVDFTATNWDNMCLVKSDQSAYYDIAAGFKTAQSYGILTLSEKVPQGDGHYPCEGPWGDWTTTGGNEKIVSPGYWRINFNMDTMELVMLETQWAISGSAIDDITAMIFAPEDQVWKLTCNLSAGSFKFVTIPVTAGDPVLEYGAMGANKVISGGNAINVEAGEYEIVLDLHNAADYTYSVHAPAEKVTAKFVAAAPATKSAVSGNAIVFTEEDAANLNIYQVTMKGDTEKVSNLELASTEVGKDGTTLTATAEVEKAEKYCFRSVVAADASSASDVKISASQKPSAESYDPTADLLVADECNVNSVDEVALAFSRKVAVGVIEISGIVAGDKVTGIEITSDKALAGTYDTATGEYTGTENTIKLEYEKPEVNGTFNAYFVAIPDSDETISVKVTTEKYEYTGTASATASLNAGSIAKIKAAVTKGGESTYPLLYLVKTGDRFVDDKKFTVDPEKNQKIFSAEKDANFEGYIDLTGTNWDNIGFVKEDLSGYYDLSGGFSGGQSYGTLTLVEKGKPDGIQYVCDGPWGDWTTTAGNPKIVSPGIWKVNFNTSTKELVMLETQWAISGSAVSDATAMTYDAENKVWKLSCDLASGSFKFVTIPVNSSDPVVEYGAVADGKVNASGSEISVSAGSYDIVLDLANGPEYTYTIEAGASACPFLYFVKTGDRYVDNLKYTIDPEKTPKVYPAETTTKFEGYVDLTGTGWDNVGLVKSDLSSYFDSTSGFSGGQSYGTLILVEETPEPGSVQYPMNGPWGDWTTNGGNDKIVSPGIWKVNFDLETKELVMLETQWAIGGSAVNEVTAMTYDSENKVWTVSCTLSEGSFKFVTIPVNSSDPVVEYGESTSGCVNASGSAINVKAGDYTIKLDLSKAPNYTYSIKSDATPFMYFVKTGDRYVDNLKYTIDPEKTAKVYAPESETKFEGFVDLTGTGWDNVGLVKSDLSAYFDSTSGFSGGQSYGTLTLVEETPDPSSVQYPMNGPWGDWTTNGGNDKIISPGIWKVNFDLGTKELVMLETQWAISGNAVSDVTAMTYDSANKVWTVSCTLSEGTIKFVTIPVNSSDPVLEFGASGDGKVKEGGDAIAVSAGSHEITLNLGVAGKYTYSIK